MIVILKRRFIFFAFLIRIDEHQFAFVLDRRDWRDSLSNVRYRHISLDLLNATKTNKFDRYSVDFENDADAQARIRNTGLKNNNTILKTILKIKQT